MPGTALIRGCVQDAVGLVGQLTDFSINVVLCIHNVNECNGDVTTIIQSRMYPLASAQSGGFPAHTFQTGRPILAFFSPTHCKPLQKSTPKP